MSLATTTTKSGVAADLTKEPTDTELSLTWIYLVAFVFIISLVLLAIYKGWIPKFGGGSGGGSKSKRGGTGISGISGNSYHIL